MGLTCTGRKAYLANHLDQRDDLFVRRFDQDGEALSKLDVDLLLIFGTRVVHQVRFTAFGAGRLRVVGVELNVSHDRTFRSVRNSWIECKRCALSCFGKGVKV